jgi:hypothetical protein
MKVRLFFPIIIWNTPKIKSNLLLKTPNYPASLPSFLPLTTTITTSFNPSSSIPLHHREIVSYWLTNFRIVIGNGNIRQSYIQRWILDSWNRSSHWSPRFPPPGKLLLSRTASVTILFLDPFSISVITLPLCLRSISLFYFFKCGVIIFF